MVTLEMLKYEPVKYISKGEKAPIRIIGISIPKIAVKKILVLIFKFLELRFFFGFSFFVFLLLNCPLRFSLIPAKPQ